MIHIAVHKKMLFCCFIIWLVTGQFVYAVDDPMAYHNSICGKGTPHGVSHTGIHHHSHNLCEPFVDDFFSLNDFSMTHDIGDGCWSYGSPVRVTSRRAKPVSRPPQRIRTDELKNVWIKNPFYQPDNETDAPRGK